MDSFTTQDCSHYSTAPFQYITDANLQNGNANNLTPGLFIRNEDPKTDFIDKESTLVGLDNRIGKCETVDVQSLNKAKELSSGLQRLYDVRVQNTNTEQQFMNNTRLTQPEESISELGFNRFTPLFYNPQALDNIVQDGTRGGTWSRNQFKDNYECPVADTRGGNM